MNLDAGIREEIIGFAQKCKIRKVILFENFHLLWRI